MSTYRQENIENKKGKNKINLKRTKVCQFKLASFTDEQVLRLDVSVQHAPLVAVGEPPEQLEQEQADIVPLQAARVPLHVLRKVGVLQRNKQCSPGNQMTRILETPYQVTQGVAGQDTSGDARAGDSQGTPSYDTHHIFEHEGQGVPRVHDVVQRDDVGVLEVLEQRCFSDGREGSALLLLQADLLEGDHLVGQAGRESLVCQEQNTW